MDAHRSRAGSDAWRPALLAGAGVLGVASIAALAASRRRPRRARRFALVGDSYAVGLGPQLEQLLPDFHYEAHGGTNTAQWARNSTACGTCGSWIAAYRPDVTVVVLGVNDGGGSVAADYRTIAERIARTGSRIVWVQPPADVYTNPDLVRQTIDSLGVVTVPPTQTPLSSDGVHPQAYGGWAREIAQYARRVVIP